MAHSTNARWLSSRPGSILFSTATANSTRLARLRQPRQYSRASRSAAPKPRSPPLFSRRPSTSKRPRLNWRASRQRLAWADRFFGSLRSYTCARPARTSATEGPSSRPSPADKEPIDRLEESGDGDWFGKIGLTAALKNLLLIALHCERRYGDHGNFAQVFVILEPLRDLEAGDLW